MVLPLEKQAVMASPWRRRRMCMLVGDTPAPAALLEISGRGAFLETRMRPAIGAEIELRHPEAGSIAARVRSIAEAGISVEFAFGERSVAFALAAIAADMSRPQP